MILWLLGGLGFFALLAAALWFGLSGIPAGDSRDRKNAETNAHGREFLFDDAQDFDDDEPADPKLLAILDAIRDENRSAVARYFDDDVAAYKREYIGTQRRCTCLVTDGGLGVDARGCKVHGWRDLPHQRCEGRQS